MGNLMRGLKLYLYGAVISLITWLVVPEIAIWFGVITFLVCAILLMMPLEPLLNKIPPSVGLGIFFALFLLFRSAIDGHMNFFGNAIALPAWLYEIRILMPLGFPAAGFQFSDYFPIFPWFFLYVCGYFLGRLVQGQSLWERIATIRLPFLVTIGKKSLLIYFVHQPLCMLLAAVLYG